MTPRMTKEPNDGDACIQSARHLCRLRQRRQRIPDHPRVGEPLRFRLRTPDGSRGSEPALGPDRRRAARQRHHCVHRCGRTDPRPGPAFVCDGNQGQQIVNDLHGRYYEQTLRGNLFTAHAIVTAPVIYTTAAGTGGPLLWNGSSTVRAAILAVGWGISTVTTVAAVIGLTGNNGQTAAPGSTTAVDSVKNCYMGAAAPACTAYRVGTPTNRPATSSIRSAICTPARSPSIPTACTGSTSAGCLSCPRAVGFRSPHPRPRRPRSAISEWFGRKSRSCEPPDGVRC
jgi:hypothetical protein